MKEQAEMKDLDSTMYIGKIQRFSLHDGPGIRTTVFMPGCTLKCPWCSNPEYLSRSEIYYLNIDKCLADGEKCIYNPQCNVLNASFSLCKEDMMRCKCSAIESYGQYVTENELLDELVKDSTYFDNDGGITFSGGECLLHIHSLKNVINRLHERKIKVFAESSLFVNSENVVVASQCLDGFIVDIKILNKALCKEMINGELDLYYKNLHYLCSKRDANLTFRIPLVRGYTYTEDNLVEIKNLLKRYPKIRVEIFSVHNLAESKYKKIKQEFRYFEPLSDSELEDVKFYLKDVSETVEIIKL